MIFPLIFPLMHKVQSPLDGWFTNHWWWSSHGHPMTFPWYKSHDISQWSSCHPRTFDQEIPFRNPPKILEVTFFTQFMELIEETEAKGMDVDAFRMCIADVSRELDCGAFAQGERALVGSWEIFRWSKTGKTLEKCWLFEWWKLLDVGRSNGKWWNVHGISIGMWWNNIMVLMCFDVILMGIQWEFILNNIGWIYQQHCGIPWEHLPDI